MSIKRREGRILAVQFLYQHDLHASENKAEALVEFWEMTEATPALQAYANELIEGVLAYQNELDQKIQRYLENWNLERLSPVDRNILRLALYEMHYRLDVPPVVAINEAIEIAKTMNSEESGKFINGILDRAKLEVGRALR